jgi:hypothetical protein
LNIVSFVSCMGLECMVAIYKQLESGLQKNLLFFDVSVRKLAL